MRRRWRTHAKDVAIAINCALAYRPGSDDRALHLAPLYPVGGMQACVSPHLLVGAANIIARRFSANGALATIAKEHVTSLFAVPTQIQGLEACVFLQLATPVEWPSGVGHLALALFRHVA